MTHSSISRPLEAPQRGEFVEVVPGVHWIRLPLPYRLNHINVWALADGDGWTLVDTGSRTEENVGVWQELMSKAPLDRPLRRVLVTHMHPDHIGMAGWLTRRYGLRLWISRLEYLSCRALTADTQREAPADALAFYREAGWSAAAVEAYRARFGNFGRHIHPLPDSYTRLQDGAIVRIGEHDWEVVSGNGHSPEHSCFYCAELRVLISGDQVLPKISSNVSVHPMEPDADPMADWLGSLERVKSRVPDDVLVLPAHNDCFHGLHARIAQLAREQEDALQRLRSALVAPCRVVDVFEALYRRALPESDGPQFGLATGEALANLNYLLRRGEAVKQVRDGVAWYQGT